VPYGNARSNRDTNASTPYLHPIWTMPLVAADDSSPFAQALAAWEVQRESNLAPTAVSNTAIIAGDAIIVRDLERIVAFEARTGRPLWEHDCETSLLEPGHNGLSPPAPG